MVMSFSHLCLLLYTVLIYDCKNIKLPDYKTSIMKWFEATVMYSVFNDFNDATNPEDLTDAPALPRQQKSVCVNRVMQENPTHISEPSGLL